MKHLCISVNVLIVSALFVTPGCASSKHEGESRVYNKKNGFSIVPPQGWENKSEFMGNFMCFIGPQEGDFAINFNVNVNKHDGAAIEEAGAPAKSMLKKMLTDYQVANDGFVTIDGKKCYYLSGRFKMGQLSLQNLQYYILTKDKKKVYVVTFTASVDTFDKYKPIFETTALTARTD